MATDAVYPPLEAPSKPLATHWRVLISIALLLHLTAIIAAPWSGPEPGGPIAEAIAGQFHYYLDATYSGHGYRFFAPAPGPSHLVRYTLVMADGSRRTESFPDKQTEWPRLFYHRYFMLSEKLNGLFDGEEPGDDAPPEVRTQWKRMRSAFDSAAQSYAMHLLSTTGAKQVTLELVRHNIPFPGQVAEGMKLDDPRTYQVLWTSSPYEAESL